MTELTNLDEILLNSLSKTEWKTRVQIARDLGRVYTLNQYDIRRIEHLVAEGRVERRAQKMSIARTYFEYRLKL